MQCFSNVLSAKGWSQRCNPRKTYYNYYTILALCWQGRVPLIVMSAVSCNVGTSAQCRFQRCCLYPNQFECRLSSIGSFTPPVVYPLSGHRSTSSSHREYHSIWNESIIRLTIRSSGRPSFRTSSSRPSDRASQISYLNPNSKLTQSLFQTFNWKLSQRVPN